MQRLISVITPVWNQTQELISRCIPSVQKQDYPNVQHIIVSDGPNPVLRELMRDYPVIYDELPNHDDKLSNWGSRARNHGLSRAAGTAVAYLDADNAWMPDHLDRLAQALRRNRDADFAYSRMWVHWHLGDYEVGSPAPCYGGIDTSLILQRSYVADRYGGWPIPGTIDHAPDWEMVRGWVLSGAQWVHVPHITVDYYRVR